MSVDIIKKFMPPNYFVTINRRNKKYKTTIPMYFEDMLTLYELSVLLSNRAKQLNMGNPPLIGAKEGESVLSIAERELRKKVLPLRIKRKTPTEDKIVELNPNNMKINWEEYVSSIK